MLDLLVDDDIQDRLDGELRARLEAQLERMVHAAWLTEKTDNELEVTLRLCTDAAIHILNRDYRNKDKPTDVLAFAQREGDFGDLQPEILGDIVISIDTAARQAKVDLFHELVFLGSHGLCHLLGYDHQDDEEEAAMNARMQQLIAESERSGPIAAA